MDVVFALGNRVSAEDVRARLADPPSYSSVRVMLTRLEKKGFVRHVEDGVRYVYSATVSPAAAKKTALQQHLRTFFGGSLAQMVTALVRQGSWTEEELATLRAEIDRVQKERKS
jgi:predicted transcriptional regulator